MASGIAPLPIHTTTNTIPHDTDPMADQPGSEALNLAAMPGSPSHSPTMTTWTHEVATLPSSERPSTSRVGIGSLPGNISEESVAKLPEERRTEVLPSHDYDVGRVRVRGGSIGSGGIGILPGTPNESEVMLCPDERMQARSEGKIGLMSKLKGEAKVIGGKIGSNERMVQEGRRMMGK